ncbi:MAG: argininosuccinate lyase [Bacteriovoracaceae bacterium]|nr:argininosuccinate lyase [Bacteriovoracaceae bacterium]
MPLPKANKTNSETTMKLWKKGYDLNHKIEQFTVGNDPILDLELVQFDCQASSAHAKMLKSIGILSEKELEQLLGGLLEIEKLAASNNFEINVADEDCHTAIENYLVKKFGDTGKKIHTARSRNDQVLTAIRLFEKQKLTQLLELVDSFQKATQLTIKKFGSVEIPGYTHMQKAMPTDIATWLTCFIDSFEDNKLLINSVLEVVDQSPLGTAAGFGVPVLEIDRQMTADLMGFKKVQNNPIYAQLSRGKVESHILHLCSQVMYDLNKLASDLIMQSMVEFGLVTLPVEFCTGSSIMPQKRNPDVLELVRAKYHVVLGEEFKVKSLIGNLISGYNRDTQLTKDPLFTGLGTTMSSLEIMTLVIGGITVEESMCKKALTDELYATKKVYEMVKDGVPFREAYQKIAKSIE